MIDLIKSLPDPDAVGSAEYRELHDLVTNAETLDEAIAICDAMADYVASTKAELRKHQPYPSSAADPAESRDDYPKVIDARPAVIEFTAYGDSQHHLKDDVTVYFAPGGKLKSAVLTFSDNRDSWVAFFKGIRLDLKVVAHPEHPIKPLP